LAFARASHLKVLTLAFARASHLKVLTLAFARASKPFGFLELLSWRAVVPDGTSHPTVSCTPHAGDLHPRGEFKRGVIQKTVIPVNGCPGGLE
ncbi:MAG: hypothetical protein PWR25_1765, partial [Euryarchaeota archaeon]|nr:hypothetical protein [Euryarchaeota archaeon]